MSATRYPWYDVAEGDELEQGDFLDRCPVFIPVSSSPSGQELAYQQEERDLIILTQSCDLVSGREKVTEVLLATLWRQSDLGGTYLATPKGLEETRRGNLPGFHLLAPVEIDLVDTGFRIVDFRRLVTLPLRFVRERLQNTARRVRLNPPYREHLSQAFARFCMRVGLPIDIPPFKP